MTTKKLYHIRFIHDWVKTTTLEVESLNPASALLKASAKTEIALADLLGFEVREKITEATIERLNLKVGQAPLIEPSDFRDNLTEGNL